uniref:YfiR family protein n=1 Tax=Geobacter metallireducens TaxID=28232 RepID=A0A831XEJ6_GEOME
MLLRPASILLILAFFVLSVLSVHAQERLPNEYQVKLAFLINFTKFVEWPENAFADDRSPIVLGILGDNPFGSNLDSVKGKTIHGRKLIVNRFRAVDDIRGCHILFVSSSERHNLPRIAPFLRQSGILSVGDMEKFAQKGGVINFVVENNRVGFEINLEAGRRAGLRISSKLLSLARIVHDSP